LRKKFGQQTGQALAKKKKVVFDEGKVREQKVFEHRVALDLFVCL
jgi:hypothetical protein